MNRLDPRIGILNSGKFYAFINGYDKPETCGTREEVEAALGLRATAAVLRAGLEMKVYTVTVRFRFPAWDELDGVEYCDIHAGSKVEANRIVRRRAYDDGHTVARQAYLTATEA
jgi:hypothetical protein